MSLQENSQLALVLFLAVFTGLWCLLFDVVWRMKSVRIGRLAVAMSAGWVAGVALILLGFYR